MPQRASRIFVLDTSVILYDANAIFSFKEHDVAIPLTVLEELDQFKKGDTVVNLQAREFIRHLEARARTDAGDPAFLVELAHYEWSELALALDEQDLATIDFDPDGDLLAGTPVVSPLARVLAYNYPVHRISPEFRPEAPSPQPVFLLLVRDRADEVRFLEIDALSALLLERLALDGPESGLERIDGLLADLGRADEPDLRASGIAILEHLHARDVVLGTTRA